MGKNVLSLVVYKSCSPFKTDTQNEFWNDVWIVGGRFSIDYIPFLISDEFEKYILN